MARAGFKVHRAHGYEALHFGYFEALPSTRHEEVRALVELGHQLAPHLPMRGPHHFRLEDPYTGLLVDGFDFEPHFLMSYNPPYYEELLAGAGLNKSMTVYVSISECRYQTRYYEGQGRAGRCQGYCGRSDAQRRFAPSGYSNR